MVRPRERATAASEWLAGLLRLSPHLQVNLVHQHRSPLTPRALTTTASALLRGLCLMSRHAPAVPDRRALEDVAVSLLCRQTGKVLERHAPPLLCS